MAELPSSVASFDDPRVNQRFLRWIPGDEGDVVLVGVVHDHPASVARVRIVLESVRPDSLALELPPAAVSLYRAHARKTTRFGGEMTAAIRAAPDARVIGIDAPNWSYVGRLAARLAADRVPLSTARRVLSSLGAATRQALTCRLAATLTHATSLTVTCGDPIEYDVDATDTPERQADHEQRHVAGVQALLGSTGGSSLAYRDETREACMIDRLESAREDGDVVAVVGIDHLEALEAALSDST